MKPAELIEEAPDALEKIAAATQAATLDIPAALLQTTEED